VYIISLFWLYRSNRSLRKHIVGALCIVVSVACRAMDCEIVGVIQVRRVKQLIKSISVITKLKIRHVQEDVWQGVTAAPS
jgi:hypothetical protein